MNKNNRKNKRIYKRILALMLCCFCLLATVPISAFALETGKTQITEESISEQQSESTSESLLSLSSETSESQTETDTQQSTSDEIIEPIIENETDTEVETEVASETGTEANTETETDAADSETEAGSETEVNTETETKESDETESEPVEEEIEVTQDPTITELYNSLMACDDYDEMVAMLEELTAEQINQFTSEQYSDIYNHMNALYEKKFEEENTAEILANEIHYYHFDFRIAANITIKVYNADGSTTSTTVTGTVSNPTAVIYNTSGVTWSSSDGTNSDGVKYKNVSFNTNPSTDSSGALEYASTVGHSKGSDLEFYEGDTVFLTYTLTYTLNGETHTVHLRQSVVTDNDNNKCEKANSSGDTRGFDIVVSAEDISSAMNTSVMQISKVWNDNNQIAIRPDSIIVTIQQDGTNYLVLTLADDASSSFWSMASGLTKPDGLTVTFSAEYGATINGLPQNTWDFSGSSPTYVSHTYTVSEVSQVAKEGLDITPVYGSDVSYSPDADKYEYQVYLTNTLAYETLAVQKVWDDSDSTVSHANDSVTVKLSATYSGGTVPDAWLADFLGTTTFTLSNANNWYLQMGQMPVYYTKSSSEVYQITGFQITETFATIGGTTYICDGSDVGSSGYTWSASAISTSNDENGNYYITVTNSNAPQTTTVTIRKNVGGNMGDQSKEFAFNATLSGRDYTFDGVTYSIDDEEPKSAGIGTTCNFTLKHGQSITFTGLPIGATFTVTETSYSGYVTTVDGVSGNSKEITLAETNSNIAFVNTKDVTIDTGVLLDTLPYILILGVVVVGAVLLIKRRRNRDDD